MAHLRAEDRCSERSSRIQRPRFRLRHRRVALRSLQLLRTRAVEAVPSERQVGELPTGRTHLHRPQPGGEVHPRLADLRQHTGRVALCPRSGHRGRTSEGCRDLLVPGDLDVDAGGVAGVRWSVGPGQPGRLDERLVDGDVFGVVQRPSRVTDPREPQLPATLRHQRPAGDEEVIERARLVLVQRRPDAPADVRPAQ